MIIKLLILTILLKYSSCVRVSEKIYLDLEGSVACFKRFNGTHEVGCTSDFHGNVGLLHIPQDVSDLQMLLEEGKGKSYMLALDLSLFTRESLMMAKNSSKVNGIIVLDSENNEYEESFSPAETCPNQNYGMYKDSPYSDSCAINPWNAVGNSLLYESFNFPIFLMQDEKKIKSVYDCFENHKEWPLCAIKLHSHMFGATNSEVCWRRAKSTVVSPINYCDPIMDYNVFGTLKPMQGNLSDSSITFITARADAASLFDNISPGAESAVSGIVTLLATAEALAYRKDELASSEKNILFFLFEAEVWDYLGSFTVNENMNKGEFPYKANYSEESRVSLLNYSHIDHYIELSQLGIHDSNTKMFMFSDPISEKDVSIQNDNKKLREYISSAAQKNQVDSEFVIDENLDPHPIPPASLQSFLKFENISGVVLADHGKEYSNKYYQSFLDNAKNLKFNGTNSTSAEMNPLVNHLKKIASTVAMAAYKIVKGEETVIEANSVFIEKLLYCFLINRNCTMFRDYADKFIGSKEFFDNRPAKMYASVERGENILSNITQNILLHVLGDEIDVAAVNCSSGYKDAVHKVFISTLGENGTCINSTVFMLSTRSPAFYTDGYNFSSGEYPSWSESGWQNINSSLFLLPNPAEEIALIITGVILTLLTFFVSWFCFSKSNILFETIPMPAPC